MANAGEYADDARRIRRDYSDPDDVEDDDLREALRDADFAEDAIDDILSWMPTAGEARDELGEPHESGITTREDVEGVVDAINEDGHDDEVADALTDAVSREVGAPTEAEAQRAQLSAVDETVAPGDVIDGDERSTPVSVVRSTDGDVVGTVGPSGSGRDVADEIGGEYLGGPSDLADGMRVEPAPGGREGLVYVGDDPVGEVDL